MTNKVFGFIFVAVLILVIFLSFQYFLLERASNLKCGETVNIQNGGFCYSVITNKSSSLTTIRIKTRVTKVLNDKSKFYIEVPLHFSFLPVTKKFKLGYTIESKNIVSVCLIRGTTYGQDAAICTPTSPEDILNKIENKEVIIELVNNSQLDLCQSQTNTFVTQFSPNNITSSDNSDSSCAPIVSQIYYH